MIDLVQANLKLENLPKLKRALVLAADQDLVLESWKRLESVVTRYGGQNYKPADFDATLGTDEGATDLVKLAISAATGRPAISLNYVYYNSVAISGSAEVGTIPLNFSFLTTVWQNSELTGHLKALTANDQLFDSMFPNAKKAFGHEDRSDPLYLLSNISPIIVHYFILILLSDKVRIEKLNPLMDALILGHIPYCEMVEEPGRWIVIYRP